MQEFAGVLAHEFGHFAQGAGMRLTYIIRQTSAWFARVVYERDEWDLNLERAAKSVDFRIGIVLHFTRLCIWFSRRILWVLMYVGHAISCFMLRQMEYDADSYEAKIAGSEAFARTSAKMHNLLAGSQWAYHKMEESWNNRRLPDNLPCFISLSVNNIPSEARKEFDEAAAGKKTGILDTHPCDADRIRTALALKQPGIFQLSEPATNLFTDFSELSRAATRFHYEHNMELRITDYNLVNHELTAKEGQTEAEVEKALQEYFFDLTLVFRPILISGDAPPIVATAELLQRLKQARQAMEESKPEVQKAVGEYEEAEALYQRGLDAVLQSSQQATVKAEATQRSLLPTIQAFEKHAQTRLSCALQLLKAPELAEKISEVTSLQHEAAQLTGVFACLGQAFVPLHELRRTLTALGSALEASNDQKLAAAADRRIEQLVPELEKLINEIRGFIGGVPYPFQHAHEDITLDEFARTDIPATHKLEALCNNCACHINRLLPLYRRVLGRLTFIALKVEEQV